jgi:hypothetical protein
MRVTLFAIVVFGTPVSAARSSPLRCTGCKRSKMKFARPTA